MSDLLVVEKPQQVLITNTDSNVVFAENPEGVVVSQNVLSQSVTVDNQGNLVSEETKIETVVQGGVQGPPGVPGASNQFEYVVAGQILGGNRAVTTNSLGQLVYPDPNSETSRIYGVTTQSAIQGELVQVQITGTQTESSWNWDITKPVFVGTNGVLTQTAPTTGQTLVVGYPNGPTKLFIDRQPPIYMG